jgi:hypothetical protein
MLLSLDANAWVTIIVQVVVLVVGLIGALWAFTKFVLERGFLPPVQFTLEATTIGSSRGATLIEILIHLKNIGSATLVARNIRIDVMYIENSDDLTIFDNPGDSKFGRAIFAHSLRKEIGSRVNPAKHPQVRTSEVVSPANKATDREPITQASGKEKEKDRGFLLLKYDTFVQPGVDQIYTFATSLPESSRYLLTWASFEYAQKPHRMQSVILTISRRLGLIQYSLQHATEPHKIERIFRIADPS